MFRKIKLSELMKIKKNENDVKNVNCRIQIKLVKFFIESFVDTDQI